MNKKSSAHYQREFRRRLREQGLVKKEVWIRPENSMQLTDIEKQLRDGSSDVRQPEGASSVPITDSLPKWTTASIQEALMRKDAYAGHPVSYELIDGVTPTLHLTMHEYGDLPVFLTVSGSQIIVDCVLWPVSAVIDTAAFNDAVLRTHKFFPLSTISIDRGGDGEDYYYMFGALSASSSLLSIIFEIEVLASNVIQATEAYSQYVDTRRSKQVKP